MLGSRALFRGQGFGPPCPAPGDTVRVRGDARVEIGERVLHHLHGEGGRHAVELAGGDHLVGDEAGLIAGEVRLEAVADAGDDRPRRVMMKRTAPTR